MLWVTSSVLPSGDSLQVSEFVPAKGSDQAALRGEIRGVVHRLTSCMEGPVPVCLVRVRVQAPRTRLSPVPDSPTL